MIPPIRVNNAPKPIDEKNPRILRIITWIRCFFVLFFDKAFEYENNINEQINPIKNVNKTRVAKKFWNIIQGVAIT